MKRNCQVVLLATETPDVVDLGDAVGFVQYVFSTSQRRGTVSMALAPSSEAIPIAKGGKKDSSQVLPAVAPSPSNVPVTLMFDRTGLGGVAEAPVALEGVEFTNAVVQALNRIAEQHSASTNPVDMSSPNRIVVIGCPSTQTIEAIANSGHELRMLITITSVEAFPSAPSATAVKGGKKAEPKKAAGKGGKTAASEKSGSASNSVRFERYMRNRQQFSSTTRFVRVHCPSAAATEGVVLTSLIPELLFLESNYAEFSQWITSKKVLSMPYSLTNPLNLPKVVKQLCDVESITNDTSIARQGDHAEGHATSGAVESWNTGVALECLLGQATGNVAAEEGDIRNIQKIDVVKWEQMKIAAAAATATGGDVNQSEEQPPGLVHDSELPRKGLPTMIQRRADIEASDPDQVQWLVRQFMKKSLGKLHWGSEQAKEINERLRGDAFSARQNVARTVPSDAWMNTALQSVSEHVAHPPATGIDRDVPQGALLLKRATASSVKAPNQPAVEEELAAAVERSHTHREIRRGLTATMLEQLTKEEFPSLAASQFSLQPYLFTEAMNESGMANRITQFVHRFGAENVKVVRMEVDDIDNVNGLTSAVSEAARLSKAAPPKDIVIAAVQAPVACDMRAKATISLASVSGLPNFSQFVSWNSAKSNRSNKDNAVLSSSLTHPRVLEELLQQTTFFDPRSRSGGRTSYQLSLRDECRYSIFPHDSSVVEVTRRAFPSASGRSDNVIHSVRFSKDDVVACLHASRQHNYFTGSFDDGTVLTIRPLTPQVQSNDDPFPGAMPSQQQQQQQQHPLRSESPVGSEKDGGGANNSRAPSSQRASRQGTSQGLLTGLPPPSRLSVAEEPILEASVAFDNKDGEVEPAAITDVPALTISVAYGETTLSIDEQTSNATFYFADGKIRKALVEGTLDGESIQTFVEFEVSRLLTHSNGCVVRTFASGSKQLLHADGCVATLIRRESHPQPFWLITNCSGEQFVRGEFAGGHRSVKLNDYFVDVRQTIDRENNCDIFSRADGVVIAFYRDKDDQAATRYTTRVVVHGDDTTIVSRLFSSGGGSMDNDAKPPVALEALMRQIRTLSSMGTVSYLIETPNCPRYFAFARKSKDVVEDDSTILAQPDGEFFIECGDGSVLQRELIGHFGYEVAASESTSPALTATKGRQYLQTTFCKVGESTIRCNHDSGLVFVETSSVHLSPLNMTSVALCEGVGVFDMVLGGFRLVDFLAHVTAVENLFNLQSFPQVDCVKPSTETELLIAMAPTGYTPHALPKRHRDALYEVVDAQKRVVQERGLAIPPLVERLRDLCSRYIVDNRLISKGPRRGHKEMQLGVTSVSGAAGSNIKSLPYNGANASGQINQDIASATIQQMIPSSSTAAISNPTSDTLFQTAVRPLLFAVGADGNVTQLMCAQDVTSFMHFAHLQSHKVTASRMYCSGEPGIEQLTFVGDEVSAFGNKKSSISIMESPLESATHWLPRTLLPPRRRIDVAVTNKVRHHSQHHDDSHIRVIMRYQPISLAARMTSARHEVRRQDQVLAMHRYNASIQRALCPTATREERDMQEILRHQYMPEHHVEPQVLHVQEHHMHDADVPVTDFAVVEEREGGGEGVGDTAGNTTQEVPIHASAAAASRRRSQSHQNLPVSFHPSEADFGPLIAGFRYALPVVLRSQTTDTLLFEVFRNKRKVNGVQLLTVRTSSFIVSPLGESTMYVMLNLPEDVVDVLEADPLDDSGKQKVVHETLRLECTQLKSKFEIKVRATVSPSLHSVKTALTTPQSLTLTERKPKVDTHKPPVSDIVLQRIGYYGDLQVHTEVRVVGPAA